MCPPPRPLTVITPRLFRPPQAFLPKVKVLKSDFLDSDKKIQVNEKLQNWIDKGVRGLTSNPSIFEKAISDSEAYDQQFQSLIQNGSSIEDAYWRLVQTDIADALVLMEPIYDSSNGIDGYVSVEVDPRLARNTRATEDAARFLFEKICQKIE